MDFYMSKKAKEILKCDIFRYYGTERPPLKKRIFTDYRIAYLTALRGAQNCTNTLTRLFYKLRLRRLQRKTFIQIHETTRIGKGFYIGHMGHIVINPEAVLGDNVNIAAGVTIGQENRGKREGAPVIGNCVWIGANAAIVGNIRVGDDVLIAPNAYVNFDVPSHSVVIGNPATASFRENACEGYINRRV